MSQSDESYFCEELPGVGVILAGVTFVKNYHGGSYLYEGGEPTISLTGYEPVGTPTSFGELGTG